MADSIILSDGTNDYEFVYDVTTQNDFKVHYGVRAEAGEPEPLWHRPDSASPKLIRLKNQTRTVFLTQNVYGDDWDDVINTLAPIKRLVDGEDQQAARYHTHGDVDKVYLRIQLDGMTNYTDAAVIYGHVDDSGSFYTPAAILNKRALGVVVMLVVEPLGTGATITLRNDLASSPHFLIDSDADGRGDGWDATASAPTYAINTTSYLTGGKSQQLSIVSAASTRGIKSAAVTASTSTPCVAYIWIRTTTNSDRVYVVLRDGSDNDIQAKSFRVNDADGVSDKTAVDSAGNTWYRVVVSGTNTTAANFRLWVVRNSADSVAGAVVLLDNAYLQTGVTTAPNMWASTSAIKNRNDPASTSAATQAQINTYDIWGVPGDTDALTKLTITLGGVVRTTILASRHTDGSILAANMDHWIESSELSTASSSGTWSTVADANRSGGQYKRFTEGGTPGTDARAYISLTGSLARGLLKYPRRFFIIAKSGVLNTEFVGVAVTAGLNLTDKTSASTTGTGVATIGTWEMLDLGLIQGVGLLPDSVPSDSDQEVTLSTYVQGSLAAEISEIDAFFLPVVGDEFAVWVGKESTKMSGVIIFDGPSRRVISEGSGINEELPGSLWYAAPGKMNRYIFGLVGSNGEHALTDNINVVITVTPRTRHLLGTS